MGRYYNGDINGKFWFAVQESNDADFFIPHTRQYSKRDNEIYYVFKKTGLNRVIDGLDTCIKKLGKYKDKMTEYFAKRDFYSDTELASVLKLPVTDAKELLVWYARLELGNEIAEHLKRNDKCVFSAEC